MYIDDNIQIDITFLLIGVTLFERGKKDKKNTLYFPYKLILKRFAYFLYFLYSSFKARFFFIKLIQIQCIWEIYLLSKNLKEIMY
jgi:hypothetical protein